MQQPFSKYIFRMLCLSMLLSLPNDKLALAQTAEAVNPLRDSQADGNELLTKQTRIADRYDRLELLAGRLAELSHATQPRRARLLRELVAKSRERDIAGRFDVILKSLESESLGKASTVQVELQTDLKKLLELLLQEDRGRQIESERKRVLKYLAEVKRLIQFQRGIKARTDGGDEEEQLSKDQGKLSDATGKLQQQIQATEGSKATDSKPSDQSSDTEEKSDSSAEEPTENQSEPSQGEQTKGDADPSKGKNSAEKSQENQSPEGKPSSSGKPNESTPSSGQGQSDSDPSQNGSPSDQQPPSPAERAQERLKKAQQRMQQALERLKEAQRENAVDRQEQALRELEQAKAELERILRQLREEEMERMLVLLEARFRKMLDAQVEVYEETKKLDSNQDTVPEHEIEIASGRLDRKQRQIVREAERALVLLREDGTTVAFPEAIEQARDDMKSVSKRLGEVKIGVITQGLEEDIISALEETLAALQQAIKELREQKSQPQSSQQGSPQEKPLVDQLAELRMIRALQNRINRRTIRYGEILGEKPAMEGELLQALDELASRQERVFQATRDLDSGRNR